MRILDWLVYLARRLVAFVRRQQVIQLHLMHAGGKRMFYPGCRLVCSNDDSNSGARPTCTVLRLRRGALIVAMDRQ